MRFLIASTALIATSVSGASIKEFREKKVSLEAKTSKPPNNFQTCFSESMESEDYRPLWSPNTRGGTFIYSISGRIFWIIDVATSELGTSVIVHGGGRNLEQSDRALYSKIKNCL